MTIRHAIVCPFDVICLNGNAAFLFQDASLLGPLEDGLNALLNIEVSNQKSVPLWQ